MKPPVDAPEQLGEPLDLSVVDVSFISLKIVLPVIKTFLKEKSGQVLCLIKPQFEAGKEKVGKKGVVRDPAVHKEVLDDFVALTNEIGFKILGLTFSPVRGPEGNIEFLAHLTLADTVSVEPDTEAVGSWKTVLPSSSGRTRLTLPRSWSSTR